MRCTRLILPLGLGAWSVLAAAVARAEPPLYVGVAQAFAHDTNLFRAARGTPETEDTISTTSLLAGADQRVGRQRFVADLALRHNRYRDNSQLDNTGYSATAGLDWEAIDRLSGRLSYATHRSLNSFGSDGGPALTTKNEERSQELFAGVGLGLASLLSIEAGWRYRQLDYSAVEFSQQELRQNGLSAGLLYRPSGLLTLGAGVRHTRGKYPYAVQTLPGTYVADEFDRDDIDFSAVWVPTGLSTVRVRVSYTRESHEQIPTRDVDGVTASLRWEYQPTAKLFFTTDASRDTGAESTFYRISTGGDSLATSSNRLSTTVQLTARYEATAKIQVLGHVRHVDRDLVTTTAGPAGVVSAPAGSDRTTETRLGLNYAPARSWLLGCSVGQERRSASSSVSYAYRATIANCSVQFRTQ